MLEASLSVSLPEEATTAALGAAVAQALMTTRAAVEDFGVCIYLRGELGSGKTTLVRALLRQAGVTGAVKSPTFALLEPYVVSRLHFYHFDFYRFKTPDEFPEGGFEEYFGPGAICLVEWPERAGAYLPPADLLIHLEVRDAGRHARLQAYTETGRTCLERVTNSGTVGGVGS